MNDSMLIGEGHDAGGVLLLENQISERGGEGAGVVEFGDAVGGIVHRCAGVEQQVGAQVGFVLVLFDHVAVEFAERLPVDAADLVARRILAVLFELDAEAFGAALVHAGHQPFDHPTRAQGEIGDARQHLGVEIVFIVSAMVRLRRREPRIAICSIMLDFFDSSANLYHRHFRNCYAIAQCSSRDSNRTSWHNSEVLRIAISTSSVILDPSVRRT